MRFRLELNGGAFKSACFALGASVYVWWIQEHRFSEFSPTTAAEKRLVAPLKRRFLLSQKRQQQQQQHPFAVVKRRRILPRSALLGCRRRVTGIGSGALAPEDAFPRAGFGA